MLKDCDEIYDMDFLDERMGLPIQGVSIDWDKIDGGSYLREIEAIKGLDYLSFNNKITIFVGENGSGKSTMLEAIAVSYGFNPEGGTKNYSFSTYDSHSELCNAIKLSRGVRKPKWGYFLRAEILSFDDGQIHQIDYEDTDSYQITKMFIENKEHLLKRLLSDDGVDS